MLLPVVFYLQSKAVICNCR